MLERGMQIFHPRDEFIACMEHLGIAKLVDFPSILVYLSLLYYIRQVVRYDVSTQNADHANKILSYWT